jgi:hypothetical protein
MHYHSAIDPLARSVLALASWRRLSALLSQSCIAIRRCYWWKCLDFFPPLRVPVFPHYKRLFSLCPVGASLCVLVSFVTFLAMDEYAFGFIGLTQPVIRKMETESSPVGNTESIKVINAPNKIEVYIKISTLENARGNSHSGKFFKLCHCKVFGRYWFSWIARHHHLYEYLWYRRTHPIKGCTAIPRENNHSAASITPSRLRLHTGGIPIGTLQQDVEYTGGEA